MSIGQTISNFVYSYNNFAAQGMSYVQALRAKEEQAVQFASAEITEKLNAQMDSKLWSNTKDILNNTLSRKA